MLVQRVLDAAVVERRRLVVHHEDRNELDRHELQDAHLELEAQAPLEEPVERIDAHRPRGHLEAFVGLRRWRGRSLIALGWGITLRVLLALRRWIALLGRR